MPKTYEKLSNCQIRVESLSLVMKKKIIIVIQFLLIIFLASCATGPKFSEIDSKTILLDKDKSQVVVYRSGVFAFLIQPTIYFDGKKTGACEPNGVFIINTDEGKHTIMAATETDAVLDIQTLKNERVYIKCEIGMGILIGRPKLSIINPKVANDFIKDLSFLGNY